MTVDVKPAIRPEIFNNMEQFMKQVGLKDPNLVGVVEGWFATHPEDLSVDILEGQPLPSVNERIKLSGGIESLHNNLPQKYDDRMDHLLKEAARGVPISKQHAGQFVSQVIPNMDWARVGVRIRTLEEDRVLQGVEGITHIKKISPTPGAVNIGFYRGYSGILLPA